MTSPNRHQAQAAATALAEALTQPPAHDTHRRGLPQSLSQGAAGIALLHAERARSGMGDWNTVQAWLQAATRQGLHRDVDACLLYGAPAAAFAVHTAAEANMYRTALTALDANVATVTRQRLARAHARIDDGEPARLAEFDLFHGLTGLGAYWLHRHRHTDLLCEVLTYLVRLVLERLHQEGEKLPGWWTDRGPVREASPDCAGGHANLGMAHGISGPLALLAQALRRGVTVPGQRDALEAICAWLDTWRHDTDANTWWPRWITRTHLRTGRSDEHHPLRPSWCYGTPGMARAQQLAALATGDVARQEMAEQALARCVADLAQLAQITDAGLCHGWAGLYQTAWRAARDATTPALVRHLPPLLDRLLNHPTPGENTGLLNGDAGHALALHTAATDTPPASGWDAFLLIN